MSFRLARVGRRALLIAMAISGLQVPSLNAQGTVRSKRDFSTSETNTADIFRSLNQLGSRNDGLRRLDEELSKSGLPYSRRNMESEPLSVVPAPLPAVQPRRKKTDLTDGENWLSKPDKLLTGGVNEDSLGFPGLESDNKDLKKASWSQIYQKLKQEDSTGTGLGTAVKSNSRQPSDTDDDDADMPAAIKGNTDFLKKQLKESDFGSSIFTPTTAKSSFSDFFGIRATATDSEQDKAHKAYINSYVTSVFGDSSPAAAVYATSKDPSKAVVPSPLSSLPTVPKSDSPTPGSIMNASISPTALPDLNAKVLNQWNPLYAEPKIEVPKSAPLFTPPVEAPRRRF